MAGERKKKGSSAHRWGGPLFIRRMKIFYVVMQCTWGALQTCLGLLLYLYCRKAPHEIYHGAVYTGWKLDGGISLGLFIFAPCKEELWCRQMAVHEYGHTWQSLMLGPAYLAVVGLPSIVWSRSGICIRMRRERGIPYSAFYTESWADRLGEKMTAFLEQRET